MSESDLPDNPAQARAVAIRLLDWAAIRHAYEHQHDITVEEICRQHGIQPAAMRWQIDREKWTRRRPPKARPERIKPARPTRKQLIDRMLIILERHVIKMENDEMAPTDKEAALLSNASRTLSKLVDLEQRRGKPDETRVVTQDMAELRKKIADRIAQLNQG